MSSRPAGRAFDENTILMISPKEFPVIALASLAFFILMPEAMAVPSFAVQTGQSCVACHQGGEFPVLTNYGRTFKINGYVDGDGESKAPPISFFIQPSFTSTARDQPGGAAPHFSNNDNAALSQASIIYAGRLFGPYAADLFGAEAAKTLDKFGVFLQATYDGVGDVFTWDNAEIRYADSTTFFGQDTDYGFYLNNNPTMQDPWNSTPVWGFPYSGSGLAPGPAAATLIDGGFGQQVLGAGAYAMISKSVYLDFALYRTAGVNFQQNMGVDTSDEAEISGVAPYWRLAYTKNFGDQSFEAGIFGLAANTYPGRDSSAGKDSAIDWGIDAQYQAAVGKNYLTGTASLIYEEQNWDASNTMGNTTNRSDHLITSKIALDYIYDKTVGGTIGYFLADGSRDARLYPDSRKGSPLSDGLILQANYLPFGKSGGPSFWPNSSLKLSAQYVIYNRFDGSSSNYDGSGRDARDNNTLYFEAWVAF